MALFSGLKSGRTTRLQLYKCDLKQKCQNQIPNCSYIKRLHSSSNLGINSVSEMIPNNCNPEILIFQNKSFLNLPLETQNMLIEQNSRLSLDLKGSNQAILLSQTQKDQNIKSFKDNCNNNVFFQAVLRQTQKRKFINTQSNNGSNGYSNDCQKVNQKYESYSVSPSCFYDNRLNQETPERIKPNNFMTTNYFSKSSSDKLSTDGSREIIKIRRGRFSLLKSEDKRSIDSDKSDLPIQVKGIKVFNPQKIPPLNNTNNNNNNNNNNYSVNNNNNTIEPQSKKHRIVIKEKKFLEFVHNKLESEKKVEKLKQVPLNITVENFHLHSESEGSKKINLAEKNQYDSSLASDSGVIFASNSIPLTAIGKSLNVKKAQIPEETSKSQITNTSPSNAQNISDISFPTEMLTNYLGNQSIESDKSRYNSQAKSQSPKCDFGSNLFIQFPGFEDLKLYQKQRPIHHYSRNQFNSKSMSLDSKTQIKQRPTTSPSCFHQLLYQKGKFQSERKKVQYFSPNSSFFIRMLNSSYSTRQKDIFSSKDKTSILRQIPKKQLNEETIQEKVPHKTQKRESPELIKLVSYYHHKYEDKLGGSEKKVKKIKSSRINESTHQFPSNIQQAALENQSEEILPWSLLGEEVEENLILSRGSSTVK